MRQLSLLDDVDGVPPPPHPARMRVVGVQSELRLLSPVAAREQDRGALERQLEVASGGRIALVLTDNRRTMLSVRHRDGVRHVRLHHMFLEAPPEVVQAVGRYVVRAERFASAVIDRFIEDQQHRIRVVETEPPTLRPSGEHHDLSAMVTELSQRYFGGEAAVPITWGRTGAPKRRRRGARTLRMGTYVIDEGIIRIHPVLDQAFVPRYFVEWVVFHEMLHHVVGAPVVDGRRIYHGPEFRRRERAFHDLERAREWERNHIGRLLRSRAALAARQGGRETALAVD